MKREISLVKNTLILSISTFIPKLASIFTLPIVTAYVAKSDLGIFDLVMTGASFLLPLITLQIQAAAFRFLIDVRDDNESTKRIISTIISFVFIISVAAMSVMLLTLHTVSFTIRLLVCIYYLLYICTSSLQQIARGLSKNGLYSFSSVVSTITNLVLTVLLVMLMRMGLNGLLISLAASSLASSFILLFYGGIIKWVDIRSFSFRELKNMLNYSWPMIPNALSLWAMNLSDRLVISFFLGLEANAIYAVANKIPLLFDSVQSTFIQAWQENASISSKDIDSCHYYTSMFDSVSRILSGLMCMLIAVTPMIFKLFIRGEYRDAYYQMPILFMGMLCSCISSFLGGIYVAYKQTRSVGITASIAAIINLVVDLLLIKHIGMYAGSLSTLLSYLTLMIFRMKNIQRIQKIRYSIPLFILLLGVPSLMCVLCFMNNVWINLMNLLLGIIFALVINRNTILVLITLIHKKIIN